MALPASAGDPLILTLAPVPILRARIRSELATDFPPGSPARFSRAPGRLDVMGGIADYTGSLVCQATLDRAAAVALSPRSDRQLQVFSFNLHDENLPFTFRIPLDSLADRSVAELAKEFSEPGRKWAGYIAGCLKILQEHGLVDLRSPSLAGMNLALYSTVPLGAGVSSSAAIEVATMMNLCGHLGLLDGRVEAIQAAAMCQEVENRIVGAPCGIMDQVASCCGREDSLLRLLCQPHQLQNPLPFPEGVRAVGIDSRVKHSVGGIEYGRTRCAAFMAHRMILAKMGQIGEASGKTLQGDPTGGYLATLAPDDYKRFFRPYLPEWVEGKDFLAEYGSTMDTVTKVDPAMRYPVQHAADHHVLEAQRVRNFVAFLDAASAPPAGSEERDNLLNKAGHLMYASHLSYTNDAMQGAPECDLLVQLVREREFAGLYGAKITGGGCGGTVAILCDRSSGADEALAAILDEYQRRSGNKP
ncbi:MAG: galactokinase family protein, partial [Tepidisphaeraceae bacterium]